MLKQDKANNSLWLVVLLMAIAFGFRVYRLDAQDIWGDEAMSIFVSALPFGETLTAETNPPIYFWILRIGRALWGSSVFGLRFLTLLCSILTVALTAAIGRQVGGRRLRNWALFAAALSPFLIYYAQEARMYATVQVGAAGSLLLFLHILQRQQRDRSISAALFVMYAALSLLGLFSHYYMAALLIAQGLVALVVLRRKIAKLGVWLLVWAGMALLFVPYFLYHRQFWDEQLSLRAEEWAIGPLLTIGQRVFTAFTLGITISAEQAIWTLPLILLMGTGALYLLRKHRLAGGMLITCIFVGIVYAWAITPILPFFWERYLLPIVPPFIVLIAAGLAALSNWRKWLALPIALLVLLLSLRSISNYYFEPQYVKGGYGQAMRLIADRGQGGDFILLNGPLQALLFDYYRPEGFGGTVIPRGELLDDKSTDEWMRQATESYSRIWLVESGNPAEFDPDGVARGWLARNGRFAMHRDFTGVGMDLFILGGDESMETATDFNFGDEVQLAGFSVEDAEEFVPGDPVLLTLFWTTDRALENAYTVFTHVTDSDGNVVAQADRQPVGGSRPTNSWQVGEMIVDSYAILLPEDVAPGEYRLRVGLYLWPDLTRLVLVDDGGDSAELTTILVK